MNRYCKHCGFEIESDQPAWVMNREGRGVEYFHAGCDVPPGYAERINHDPVEAYRDAAQPAR